MKKYALYIFITVALITAAFDVMPAWAQTAVANSTADLAGKIVMLANSTTPRTVTNLFTFDRDPSAPFAVTSGSAKVTNLNADLLDGVDGTGYARLWTPSGTTAFTPTWGNTGTANTLGNGTIQGEYLQVDHLVYYNEQLRWGSTTVSGNGSWTFSIPFTADSFGAAQGSVLAFDSSSGAIYAGTTINAGTGATPTTLAAPVVGYAATVPYTWATNDVIMLHGWVIVP